jgi:hypothetical protein
VAQTLAPVAVGRGYEAVEAAVLRV